MYASTFRRDLFAISLFENVYDTEPVLYEATWDEFCDFLAFRETGDKMLSPCWSPARFSGRRSSTSVESVCMFVGDVDGGMKIGEAARALSGLACVLHTTYSSTPPAVHADRFRLIVPLSRDVEGREWSAFWKGVVHLLSPSLPLDRSCSDASRAWLWPCHPPGVESNFIRLKGGYLDVDSVEVSCAARVEPVFCGRPTGIEEALRRAVARSVKRGRNNAGFSLARDMRDSGVPYEYARGVMMRYVEEVGPRGSHPYTASEAMRTLASVYNHNSR